MENTMQDLTLALIQAKQVWEDTDANLNLFQKKSIKSKPVCI